ncbi:hypothetical protein Tco_0950755 [Tanacetum coccineum]
MSYNDLKHEVLYNDTLTAELERYKEQVNVLKEGQNVDLRSKDNVSDSCAQSIEIDLLKQTLSEHLIEKESLLQTYQLADIFTKALGRKRIEFLINKLGMRSFTPETLKQLADEVDE